MKVRNSLRSLKQRHRDCRLVRRKGRIYVINKTQEGSKLDKDNIFYMKLKNCHNINSFKHLAKKKLPSPIFNYIDGAAEDEVTYRRNTKSFDDVDLVPNVLRGVEDVDLTTTVFGKKINIPIYCAPTAVQRLFHFEGEKAVAKAASKIVTMFGVSSLSTVSVEEIEKLVTLQKCFNFIFIKIVL